MNRRATCTRLLVLAGMSVLLQAGDCDSSSPQMAEENCEASTVQGDTACTVDISMRNASSQVIHLWAQNETISLSNRLQPGVERCRTATIAKGGSSTVTVFAGQDGATLNAESVTLTNVRENMVVNADWNGTSLSLSTRTGTTICVG